MAIGNQVNYSTASLHAELGQVALEMHAANDHASDFFERVNKLGVTGLKNVGMDDATANAFFTLSNQMSAAANVWFGSSNQAVAFPYDDASAAAR
jgi:hypothetical protein